LLGASDVAIALQAPPTSRYGDPVVASHGGCYQPLGSDGHSSDDEEDADEVEYGSQSQTLTRSCSPGVQTTMYSPLYSRVLSVYC